MHFRYNLEGDLVTIRTGTVPGDILPVEFIGFQHGRLRHDGNNLIDCTDRQDWLLDDQGRLRLPSMHPGSAWPAVNCAWDTKSVLDGGSYRLETDADRTAEIAAKRLISIKAECGRRIVAIASKNAQNNMLANYTVGTMTAAQKATFEAGLLWIAAMQANQDVLAADDALDYLDDANWPNVPAGIVALVDQY